MWLNYGLITLRLGQSLQAVPALQKVVILDSQNALYWEVLGEAYLLRHSYETAVKTLSRAIQLDPYRPLCRILCGQAYRRLGEYYLAHNTLLSGLDRARSQVATGQVGQDILILALKEIVELKLLEAHGHLRDGLSGRAMEEFKTALMYLDEVFEKFSTTEAVPVWTYHYAASAFSLLSMINNPLLCIDVPARFLLVLHPTTHANADDASPVSVCLSVVLQLADIFFACAMRSWNRTVMQRDHRAESSIIVLGCLLITLGLHCLSHAAYLSKHHNLATDYSLSFDPARLWRTSEFALKRALVTLTDKAIEDQRFLDEHESAEGVSEVDKIAQLERTEEHVVRDRLTFNCSLRSKAWHGLALLYSSLKVSDDFNAFVDYCLCQSLMIKPTTTEAATNLALRLLRQGRIQVAASLLTQFQASDPDNYLVWLASAHFHAMTTVPTASSKPISKNHAVLQNLLQAACLGTDVQLSLHLARNLFPVLIETVSTWSSGSPSKHLMETQAFVRLAMEVTAEALNRALAFEPRNARLWHYRGLLLQLAGLTAPAAYCLRKALDLLCSEDLTVELKMDLHRCCSQYFLITAISESPDWIVADQLFSMAGEFSVTACVSLAEALAKGYIFLRHPRSSQQMDLAAKCLIDEVSRLTYQGLTAAVAASRTFPNIGQWLLVFYLFTSPENACPSNPQLTELFHSLSLSRCHPRLACTLSSFAVQLCKTVDPTHPIWTHVKLLISSVEPIFCLEINESMGHLITELDRLDSTMQVLWTLDNAAMCAYMSRSLSSGFAYLSRLTTCRPDAPDRWTAMAFWLLDYSFTQPRRTGEATALSPSQSRSIKTSTESEQKKPTIKWIILIHIVNTALKLLSEVPCTASLAIILSRCAQLWLTLPEVPFPMRDAWIPLLTGLRRAASLYPHFPGLLAQVDQFTTRYQTSIYTFSS